MNIEADLKLIADEAGRAIYKSAVDQSITKTASLFLASCDGWIALQKAGYESGEDGVWKKAVQKQDFTMSSDIAKLDEDQRLVFGWASVVEENGKLVEDHHGDTIEPQELQKAAHAFNMDSRQGHIYHNGKYIADVVETMVFTGEVQKALGIDLKKVGWWVVMKVIDDDVWKRVKDGELSMFSIGGKGKRV